MQVTVTAKIKPSPEQIRMLQDTVRAYQKGCNFVSSLVFETNELAQAKLHKMTYKALRTDFLLRSQMAQPVTKTVIARYKSLVSNGHEWTCVQFRKSYFDVRKATERVKVKDRYETVSWAFYQLRRPTMTALEL